MARSGLRISTVAALLALAVGLGFTGGASSQSALSPNPTLYVLYAMNCTFVIQDDAGKAITAIPPGAYQVDVRTPLAFGTVSLYGLTDFTACKGSPQFQLTGPGVNLFTTMSVGCESDRVFPETFLPNSTYLATDLNQPAVARGTFNTLSTGTPATPASTVSGTGGRAETSEDIVGSLRAGVTVKGALTGAVESSGKLSLLLKGKPLTTLKAGLYSFSITDRATKSSFIILSPTAKGATNLTGVRFIGKRAGTIRLKPGRWTFYTGRANMHTFVVT